MIIFAVSMLILFLWNYSLHKSITHPAVAYSFVWLLQVVGYCLVSDNFIECSTLTFVVIFLGTAAYSLGGGVSVYRQSEGYVWIINRDFSPLSVKVLAAFALAVFFLYMQYGIFVGAGSGESFAEQLVIVRTLMNFEGEDVYGIYKYGSALGFVLLMLTVALTIRNNSPLIKYLFLPASFLVSFGFSVLSTGRGAVLQIILACAAVWMVGSGRSLSLAKIIKSVFVVVVSAFLIFQVMGEAMGKASGTFDAVIQDIVDYQFSSIPALSYYLSQHGLSLYEGEGGGNTFRFFNIFLNKIGLSPEPKSLIQEFVPVPVLTNIFTNYHLFIKDFGVVGLIVFPFFLGLGHGYVYGIGVRCRSDVALTLIGVLYLPLLQSISGESYITNISKWIQVFVLAVFLTSVSSRKLRG